MDYLTFILFYYLYLTHFRLLWQKSGKFFFSFWEIEAKKNSFWDFMTFKNESIAFDSK